MKLKKYLFKFIIISTIVISHCSLSIAQSGTCPDETGLYNCTLSASTTYSSSGQIFDDGSGNFEASGFFGVYDPTTHTCPFWNCGSHFLLSAYTGTDITLNFQFSSYYALASTISSHNIIIKNITTGAVIKNTFSGIGGSFVPVSDVAGYHLITSTPGEYQIEYYRVTSSGFIATPGTNNPDITGRVVIQPKIEKLWIVATPICSGFSGTYNFQVHSFPELNTLIVQSQSWSHLLGSADCADPLPENTITLNFSASLPLSVQIPWYYPITGSPYIIPGFLWIPGTDINDYSVNNTYGSTSSSDLGYYLSGGAGYGTTPIINVTFNDGIATTMTASAPIIIESPVADILPSTDPTLYPTTNPPPSPTGYASGLPFSAFDIYNYTVTGNETWTPTNNPIANMNGNGSTVSTIRVQHNITIQNPGGVLSLVGMTLEMGPGAGITATAPVTGATWNGGALELTNSVLTAYRGCDVAPATATDHSTWAGVTLLGNPANPEVSLSGTSHPQSQLNMYGSTIAYADIGIRTGTSMANSGGIILTSIVTAPNTFHNNTISVSLTPYTYGPSLVELRNCTFLNDASAWIVPPTFMSMTGVYGIVLDNSIFTNSTGNNVAEGILSYDGGAAITNTKFNNFNYGILSEEFTSASTLHISNCTFNNNHFGIYSSGTFGPVVAGNTFNIPAYTGISGTAYPGTPVLMMPYQNAGAVINGSTGYNITNNIFKTNATTTSTPLGYYAYTTGTLEYNTGSDNNQVTYNSFTGVGVAMLSNFVNNSAISYTGLQYLCNTDTHVGYDIAALGSYTMTGGINPLQSSTLPGTGIYTYPAGNNFSVQWNIYNQQRPLVYIYQSPAATSNPQYPANIYTSVSVMPSISSYESLCSSAAGTSGTDGTTWTTTSGGGGGGSVAYSVAAANVNYYLTNTDGIQHRDSLYYWAGQMGTAYGSLLTSLLLIEDGQIDSANTVYNNILSSYSLESTEANEFTIGRQLMDVIIAKRTGDRNNFSLTSEQVAILNTVKANTTMWAHARAEGWLNAYEGDEMTDTLLYPNADFTDSSGDGSRMAYHHTNQPVTAKPSHNNQVYPNPVHDVLQVVYNAETADAITIQIEDISGRLLISEPLQSGSGSVDMNSLAPGMYLYRILEGNVLKMIGKIAKD